MKIHKHRAHVFALALVLAFFSFLPNHADAVKVADKSISSKNAYVMDFDTGITLFAYNENQLVVPASITKLLSVYVVYDAIEAGEITLDTRAVISKSVSELSFNWEFSNIPLLEGASVSIRDLLDFVIISSACAATVAIAEALYGSEESFVVKMNEKAESLSVNAVFYDCYGVSDKNRISAKGIADLTRFIILDYPQILQTTSKRSFSYMGTEYKNTNQLLGDYSGADGFKTGYTDAAGYCFVSTAKRGSRRIIAVTMGSDQWSRYIDCAVLLDYGFSVASSVISEYNRTHNAKPSNADLIIDGVELPLSAYLIGSSHFFRLRDIAVLLNETGNQFDIAFDHEDKTINITTGINYSDEDMSLILPDNKARIGVPTPSTIIIDGDEFEFEAYLIEGSNYFRLRDLSAVFGFKVDWKQATRTVIIKTAEPKLEDTPDNTDITDEVIEDDDIIDDDIIEDDEIIDDDIIDDGDDI